MQGGLWELVYYFWKDGSERGHCPPCGLSLLASYWPVPSFISWTMPWRQSHFWKNIKRNEASLCSIEGRHLFGEFVLFSSLGYFLNSLAAGPIGNGVYAPACEFPSIIGTDVLEI